MAQIIFIFITFLILLLIIWLFLRKADLQLNYKRLQSGKAFLKGDFWRFNWNDGKARQERWQAFLLFPMLFPIELSTDNDSLTKIERSVKIIHIGIYLTLIMILILAVYSEKVFT